jgi:peroxiredoxin Q/BCP
MMRRSGDDRDREGYKALRDEGMRDTQRNREHSSQPAQPRPLINARLAPSIRHLQPGARCMLKLGDAAPDFSLPADDGSTFTLKSMRGKKVLLVFYPGDETPVCTAQLCEYRDGFEDYRELGVTVIGISKDDAESHRRFKERRSLPFTLLSDRDLAVAKQYGSSGILGMKRSVFLVDEKGIVRYEHVESVSLFRRKHEELIEAIRALA